MYKGLRKLARLIKIMAKDVSKPNSYWKMEDIGAALGLIETEDFFDEISVTDDSGYRAITIGDTRGNISRMNGRKILENEHKGYVLLYSESCSYKGNKRVWNYNCFPSIEEIASRLQKIVDRIPLNEKNGVTYACMYESNEQTLEYLSGVVKKYADKIASDSRTPDQIFSDCQ